MERDPGGLPGFELATQTGFDEVRGGPDPWERATYTSDRGAQIVRRYYRDMLRERGWRIISNDAVRDGVALVTARRGSKEVNVYVTPNEEGVAISVLVSAFEIAEPERGRTRR